MSKKLLNLILGFVFASTFAFSQQQDSLKYSRQDFLPEKFRNYREKADSLYTKVISLPSLGLANMYFYDVDNDKKSDVEEIYLIKFSPLTNEFKQEKEPLFYLFDFNGDGGIGNGEFFIDPEKDGLDENDKPYDFLEPKKLKIFL